MKWVNLKDSEKLLGEGLDYSSFKVRLARTDADRDAVFRLRYDVFNEELGEGLPESALTKRDEDRFDPFCDHLMVEKNGKVVGTYRFLPGKIAHKCEGFYSETEFSLRNLPINFDEAIEMGRACIRPEHRKQSTLISLLCGLRHYMNIKDCRYLFGMASLAQMSHENALATYQEVKRLGRSIYFEGVAPLESMKLPSGITPGDCPQVPPLMGIYFKIGALVCAEPAFDPIFKCHDLLTLLRIEEVPEKTWNFFEKFAKRGEREESAA
ncbi:MAG: GNAT family N-acyltransferase [Bdellovibrionota bacterium]